MKAPHMKAIVVESPGGLDKLVLRHVPAPAPGPEDVLISVVYAACNWSDLQKREGVYPHPVKYPAIMGLEVSGRVAAVGGKVRNLAVGDRVAAVTGPDLLGGYAELCRVHKDYVIKLPDSLCLAQGAAFPVVGQTAYHLLHTAHHVRRGEVIVIHAISGAVGSMTLQLARRAGAKVIGTVGGRDKTRQALTLGAHLVVDRSSEDFVDAVLDFTGGRGADLVIDSLGGDILRRSFDALRPFGRVINIGEASGYPDFDIRPVLYQRSTSLAGFEFLHAGPGSLRWKKGVQTLLSGFGQGWLHLPVVARFPLAEAARAHELLAGRGVQGKVLLAVNEDK